MKMMNFGIVVSLLLSTIPVLGQFTQLNSSTNNSWGFRQNPPIARLGLGEFGNNVSLPSILTIDGSVGINDFPTGEVFRTNSPNGTNTFWRMFQGNQQIGNLYSLGVDIDFHIEAFQDDADIV